VNSPQPVNRIRIEIVDDHTASSTGRTHTTDSTGGVLRRSTSHGDQSDQGANARAGRRVVVEVEGTDAAVAAIADALAQNQAFRPAPLPYTPAVERRRAYTGTLRTRGPGASMVMTGEVVHTPNCRCAACEASRVQERREIEWSRLLQQYDYPTAALAYRQAIEAGEL